jgi:transposase-like protein
MNSRANRDEDLFRPPFCPEPKCPHHERSLGWRYARDGIHRRRAEPTRVQRYRCLHCGRSFSSQTFRTTYYLKRPELQPAIFRQMGACSGYRQTARVLGCAHSTVLNQARRLGRHCLLYQHRKAPPRAPTGPLVLDGLRSFEFSQYWPMDLNLVIGGNDHFIEGFNHAQLRRSGAMTEHQRKKRRKLENTHGRPEPQATRNQVETLLRRVTGAPCTFKLVSDEHRAYVQAAKRMTGWTIEHERISSKAPRTPWNPLWPANLADLLVRHGGANHKRETIAFSKRVQNALLRMAIFQVDRNFVQGRRVRDGKRSPSPAMLRGVATRRLTVDEVLAERLFPSRVRLPEDLREMYDERVPTRQIANPRRHELRYAA